MTCDSITIDGDNLVLFDYRWIFPTQSRESLNSSLRSLSGETFDQFYVMSVQLPGWNTLRDVLYSCVITPPASLMASIAFVTIDSGASFGYVTTIAFWGARAKAETKRAKRRVRMLKRRILLVR